MSTISNEVLEKLSVRYRLLAKIHDGSESQAWEESALIVEELLALRKEREKEESAVCPKCGNTGLADSGGVQPWGEPILIECDCTAPPAPSIADDSLPYDPQIAEYEQMMEAEQAQADTTSQQFESLAGKAVVPAGWKLVPIEPTFEMQIAFAEAWFSKVRCVDDCELEDAYIAMLAAAPEPCK
ncbi:hypothetical protein QMS96_19675 [Cronobacter sakazakii]|uniref:hypothetical protein n=1 Tax=Cronobacter sakazakii TaxID=28141 RepID=UPI0009B99BCE|nr:hypothetical protein [Cronobacter sakazakii]EIX1854814.1 hypothetical protein [Cronobacter sakazakii]EMC4500303.1 hypothetical protein [Cronobacter sakazakii]EMD7552764.1 hypothetical protein [Cronobacter sakazakii]EME1784802.1 hypothetical protein [Cronobacter sakazakii]MCZ6110481.1 hypothetical protein [Cronobacter sakazakii]